MGVSGGLDRPLRSRSDRSPRTWRKDARASSGDAGEGARSSSAVPLAGRGRVKEAAGHGEARRDGGGGEERRRNPLSVAPLAGRVMDRRRSLRPAPIFPEGSRGENPACGFDGITPQEADHEGPRGRVGRTGVCRGREPKHPGEGTAMDGVDRAGDGRGGDGPALGGGGGGGQRVRAGLRQRGRRQAHLPAEGGVQGAPAGRGEGPGRWRRLGTGGRQEASPGLGRVGRRREAADGAQHPPGAGGRRRAVAQHGGDWMDARAGTGAAAPGRRTGWRGRMGSRWWIWRGAGGSTRTPRHGCAGWWSRRGRPPRPRSVRRVHSPADPAPAPSPPAGTSPPARRPRTPGGDTGPGRPPHPPEPSSPSRRRGRAGGVGAWKTRATGPAGPRVHGATAGS